LGAIYITEHYEPHQKPATMPSLFPVSVLVLGIAAIYSLHTLPVATAWGKEGHEIVGNLAWKLISNQTQNAVKDILRRDDGSYGPDDDAGSPLASVADW
jgi:hypothetical protein